MPESPAQQAIPEGWCQPAFSSPRVGAVMTARAGGVSRPPYDSLNLRDEVGDEPADVLANRARLHALIGRPSVLMRQVHGIKVHRLDAASLAPDAPRPEADACVTTTSAVACEIQVADCLPVLFAHRGGRAVGAAHAGWRGLAGGVLQATLEQVCALADAPPQDIECWLGPCIGPDRFEVGQDVVEAFGASADRPGPHFRARPQARKWLANLPALAAERLSALGATLLAGGNDGHGDWCTLTHPERYFSYRHASRTGRMAALVWLRG